MAVDREVAGIRCTEVLAHLSDYLDGSVSPELRGRIEAHVGACAWCERFGGAFSATVTRLRTQLDHGDPPDAARERVLRRLAST